MEAPHVPEGPLSLVGPQCIEALLNSARSTPPGAFLEVGVYKGGTAWHLAHLAEEQGRELWLYDTFTGIPYRGPYDSHAPGDFNDTSMEAVQRLIPSARIIQGIFPQSAQGGRKYFPEVKVAFVHLDCDQNRAYRESIVQLSPHMARGGIMWFDDAPCLAGARMAVEEAFPGNRIKETQGKWWVQF